MAVVAQAGRSMNTNLAVVAVLVLLFSACGTKRPAGSQADRQTPVVRPVEKAIGGATSTNTFYLRGVAEGKRHAIERPTYSAILYPAGATNWSKESLDLYHAGYLQGLGGK